MVNNICYIFGGQDLEERLYNDMYTLSFEINETDKKFKGVWDLNEAVGKRPTARTSHSSTAYRSQYLLIVGGEGYDGGIKNNIKI